MRKMDSLGLKICSYQAMLFEKSIEQTKCSSRIFMRRFMNSELAKRMDNIGFIYDSLEVSDALIELDNQYGESTYGNEYYTANEMYWIGYLYRYWAYVAEKPSKQIYKIIKPDELRQLYFPYHSLDPMQAIERIMEAKTQGDQTEMNDIEKGVIALRKVRNKKQSKKTASYTPSSPLP